MAWLVVVAVAVLLVALTRVLINNARALRRDVNRTFDDFRSRLEADANAVVSDVLDSEPRERPPGPSA